MNNIVSKWVDALNYDELNEKTLIMAKSCIGDTLGVALGGLESPAARLARDYVMEGSCQGTAGLWGFPFGSRPDLCALANGTAAHSLDFDETNYMALAHPSVAVLPALLALTGEKTVSGRDLLTAFVAGYELTCKLGAAVNPHVYEKGWWTTSLLGAIGAAAGAAKILRLGPEKIDHALGLALNQVGGLRANFGTLAKALGAGQAAMTGVTSALLSYLGFTANRDLLKSNGAFFILYADGVNNDSLNNLGTPYALEDPGATFKRYPTCSATHAALDALFELKGEYKLISEDIKSISCLVTPLVEKCLIHPTPVEPDEARFSLQGCLALALAHGRLLPSTLTAQNLASEETRKLMGLIRMVPDPGLALMGKERNLMASEAARLEIVTTLGASLERTVLSAKGGRDNPLTKKELAEKFINMTTNRISLEQSEELWDTVEALEFLPNANRLVELTKPIS